MFTVALIGADGAGKTTIARWLEETQPLPVKYFYMGVSKSSSNRLLPTTRLVWAVKRALGRGAEYTGPPDPARAKARPKSLPKRLLRNVKDGLWLINQLAEEWSRQALATAACRRGYIVLFDRHFFTDYYAHDIAGQRAWQSWSRRLHGFLLDRFYPRPDLAILLDTPADVLYARKPEGTVALLEQRRQEYWQLARHLPHFAVVDASQSLEAVRGDVLAIIRDFGQERRVPARFAAAQLGGPG
jgi:thymidylate kinase